MASQNAKRMHHRRRNHPPCPKQVPDICEPYNDIRSGCNKQGGECMQLHICRHYIYGNCSFGERCQKSHNVFDPQPKAVLKKCDVNVARTSKEVLAELRACYQIPECPQAAACATVANQPSGKGGRENHSREMPDICTFYNLICGCAKEGKCTRLHVCKYYVGGSCKFGRYCKRSHDIFDKQPKGALKNWGVDVAGSPKQVLAELRECLTGEKAQDESDEAVGVKELSVSKDSVQEICMYHLSGQCHYKDHCRNHHCGLPYQWQWKLDDTWAGFNLSNNIACELTYSDPQEDTCLVLQGGTIYKVDFDKFTVSGGAVDMSVRRLAVNGSVNDTNRHTFVTKWDWYWQTEHLKWIPFNQGNLHLPQMTVTSDTIEKQFEESPLSSGAECGTDDWECTVDFTTMSAVTTLGEEKKLRRRPRFVSPDEFEKLKSQRPTHGASSSDSVSLPPHWDLTDTKGNFHLIKLSKQSHPNEMGTIVKRFQESGPKRGVKTVHRVQNAELWENFSRKKHHMSAKTGTNVKELLLFHGTAGKYVDHICEQGFDWRICGLSVGTRYGKGSYFARDSSYSRRFTDDHRMFAVNVLVGQYCAGRNTYVRPPPKDKADPLGPMFDACVDNIENPEIFVVFSTDQAYPAYVIEYG